MLGGGEHHWCWVRAQRWTPPPGIRTESQTPTVLDTWVMWRQFLPRTHQQTMHVNTHTHTHAHAHTHTHTHTHTRARIAISTPSQTFNDADTNKRRCRFGREGRASATARIPSGPMELPSRLWNHQERRSSCMRRMRVYAHLLPLAILGMEYVCNIHDT